MSWSYRVLASEHEGEVFFEIHEVYYDEENNPISYTANPVAISGSVLEEVKWVLEKMKESLDRDVLLKGDKFPKKYNG